MDQRTTFSHPDARARHQMLSKLARHWALNSERDMAGDVNSGRHESAPLERPEDEARGQIHV